MLPPEPIGQEAGMRTFTSADIDRYIREQPIRDANTAAQAKQAR